LDRKGCIRSHAVNSERGGVLIIAVVMAIPILAIVVVGLQLQVSHIAHLSMQSLATKISTAGFYNFTEATPAIDTASWAFDVETGAVTTPAANPAPLAFGPYTTQVAWGKDASGKVTINASAEKDVVFLSGYLGILSTIHTGAQSKAIVLPTDLHVYADLSASTNTKTTKWLDEIRTDYGFPLQSGSDPYPGDPFPGFQMIAPFLYTGINAQMFVDWIDSALATIPEAQANFGLATSCANEIKTYLCGRDDPDPKKGNQVQKLFKTLNAVPDCSVGTAQWSPINPPDCLALFGATAMGTGEGAINLIPGVPGQDIGIRRVLSDTLLVYKNAVERLLLLDDYFDEVSLSVFAASSLGALSSPGNSVNGPFIGPPTLVGIMGQPVDTTKLNAYIPVPSGTPIPLSTGIDAYPFGISTFHWTGLDGDVARWDSHPFNVLKNSENPAVNPWMSPEKYREAAQKIYETAMPLTHQAVFPETPLGLVTSPPLNNLLTIGFYPAGESGPSYPANKFTGIQPPAGAPASITNDVIDTYHSLATGPWGTLLSPVADDTVQRCNESLAQNKLKMFAIVTDGVPAASSPDITKVAQATKDMLAANNLTFAKAEFPAQLELIKQSWNVNTLKCPVFILIVSSEALNATSGTPSEMTQFYTTLAQLQAAGAPIYPLYVPAPDVTDETKLDEFKTAVTDGVRALSLLLMPEAAINFS
jgi:hypothetical protein